MKAARLKQLQFEVSDPSCKRLVAQVPTTKRVATEAVAVRTAVEVGVPIVVEVEVPTGVDVLVEVDGAPTLIVVDGRHVHELCFVERRQIVADPGQPGDRFQGFPHGRARDLQPGLELGLVLVEHAAAAHELAAASWTTLDVAPEVVKPTGPNATVAAPRAGAGEIPTNPPQVECLDRARPAALHVFAAVLALGH